MKSSLVVEFVFEASHSLSGFETPHPHLWRMKLEIGGQPVQGKILDLMAIRAQVRELLDQITGAFLNDCSRVGPSVQEAPTCETLSQFFFDEVGLILKKEEFQSENPSVFLESVTVGISDMNGLELGAVRLSR